MADDRDQYQPGAPPPDRPPSTSRSPLDGLPPIIRDNLLWIALGGGAAVLVVVVIVVVAALLLFGGGGSDVKADYIDECTDSRRGWDLDEDVCQCGWAIVEHDFSGKAIGEIEDLRNGDEILLDLYRQSTNYCDTTQDLPRRMQPDLGAKRDFGGLSSDIVDFYLDECDDENIDEAMCTCALDIVGGDFDDEAFEELEDEGDLLPVFNSALEYCNATDDLPRRVRPERE